MEYLIEITDIKPRVNAVSAAGTIAVVNVPLKLNVSVTSGPTINSTSISPTPVNVSYADLGFINFVPLSQSKTITVLDPVALNTSMMFANAEMAVSKILINIISTGTVSWRLSGGNQPHEQDFIIAQGTNTPAGLTEITSFVTSNVAANSFITLFLDSVAAGTSEFSLTLLYT